MLKHMKSYMPEPTDPCPGQTSIFDADFKSRNKRRRKTEMTLKERKAIEKIVAITSEPERFAVEMNNTPEQNEAIKRVLQLLFNYDEKGTVTGFNEEVVEELNSIPEKPKYRFF